MDALSWHCIEHTVSALGGVPFAVVRGPIGLSHALYAQPRGDLQSELWHEPLGPRLARWRMMSGLVSRHDRIEKHT